MLPKISHINYLFLMVNNNHLIFALVTYLLLKISNVNHLSNRTLFFFFLSFCFLVIFVQWLRILIHALTTKDSKPRLRVLNLCNLIKTWKISNIHLISVDIVHSNQTQLYTLKMMDITLKNLCSTLIDRTY